MHQYLILSVESLCAGHIKYSTIWVVLPYNLAKTNTEKNIFLNNIIFKQAKVLSVFFCHVYFLISVYILYLISPHSSQSTHFIYMYRTQNTAFKWRSLKCTEMIIMQTEKKQEIFKLNNSIKLPHDNKCSIGRKTLYDLPEQYFSFVFYFVHFPFFSSLYNKNKTKRKSLFCVRWCGPDIYIHIEEK